MRVLNKLSVIWSPRGWILIQDTYLICVNKVLKFYIMQQLSTHEKIFTKKIHHNFRQNEIKRQHMTNISVKLQASQFMFRYVNNLLPDHFEGLFLSKNQVHRYDTRNVNEFYIATSRTNLRQFSIKYQGPILYNNLPHSIVNSVSFSSFIEKLKNNFFSSYVN